MQHWTMQQLADRYAEVRTQSDDVLHTELTSLARKIERLRDLAAAELFLADIFDAAWMNATSRLERNAFRNGASHHRAEAKIWRDAGNSLRAAAALAGA